jgi:hypothetical protein
VTDDPFSKNKGDKKMNFKIDENQFWQGVQHEEMADCEIGAGYTGAHLDKLFANSAYFQQMRQLQAIVIRELRELLMEWDLGFGTDAAIACGQILVLERLQKPSVEIQQQLWAVLEEETAKGVQVSSPVRAQVKTILGQVLLESDWLAIADAAGQAVQRQVVQQQQLLQSAEV